MTFVLNLSPEPIRLHFSREGQVEILAAVGADDDRFRGHSVDGADAPELQRCLRPCLLRGSLFPAATPLVGSFGNTLRDGFHPEYLLPSAFGRWLYFCEARRICRTHLAWEELWAEALVSEPPFGRSAWSAPLLSPDQYSILVF